jgi:hypothetical protein
MGPHVILFSSPFVLLRWGRGSGGRWDLASCCARGWESGRREERCGLPRGAVSALATSAFAEAWAAASPVARMAADKACSSAWGSSLTSSEPAGGSPLQPLCGSDGDPSQPLRPPPAVPCGRPAARMAVGGPAARCVREERGYNRAGSRQRRAAR